MRKLPAFHLYIGDLLKDPGFRLCSWQAQNLWIRMLLHLHEQRPRGQFSIGATPMSPEQIAKLCDVPIADFLKLSAELDSNSVYSVIAGAIASRRMVREREQHENKVKAGQCGAEVRWQKHSRQLADRNGNAIGINSAYSSSSSSSSSSESEWEEEKKELPSSFQKKKRMKSPAPGDESFAAFWASYPRKVGKKAAKKEWDRAPDRPALEAILSGLERCKQSDQWQRDGGQYIPHPSTWLHQGRWDDQPLPTVQKKTKTQEWMEDFVKGGHP